MSNAPELWQAVWPRFGRVFPIELALSLFVMASAWAALGTSAGPAVFKAKFSEAWFAADSAKREVIERLALELPGGGGVEDEQRGLSRYVASRRIVGSSVIVGVAIPGAKGYEIIFAPVVAQDGAVAVWACSSSDLPERLAPLQCRPRKGA